MVGQLVTGNFPKDEMGRPIRPQVVTLVDPTTGLFGSSSQSATYSLASNITLAGNNSTTPVTIPANNSASYGFSYIIGGGTSPNMKLQALGADGTTWQDIVTGITASGQQGVVIFTGSGGAQLRLTNTTANQITGLTATLAS